MKYYLPYRLLAACMLVALFTGCKKNCDVIAGQPGCRVEKIKGNVGSFDDSLFFTYNQQGNPVSIKKSFTATGYPDVLFRYDQHNRLIQHIGYYSDVSFETWHDYVYNLQNQIVQDTQYVFGEWANGVRLSYHHRYIFKYTYDGMGRMATWTFIDDANNSSVTTYTYDSNGNLVNGKTYDNRKNIRSTNKIWMFLDHDYSVNNVVPAGPYNNQWLPLHLGSPGKLYAGSFAGFAYSDIDITYSCR
ncbi:hypothetical protein [Deminuibacter soli]|uniref:Uncharacterized protein n=1 Tax=Deminuibacter soli TaxID=2291815 RepID=A0A3E1NG05_9BACT|nr:hypothetical protein [Deminuibacter soli]RFM26817.1 hypothetical protein DXN05_17670 [Deminuibacter soli]